MELTYFDAYMMFVCVSTYQEGYGRDESTEAILRKLQPYHLALVEKRAKNEDVALRAIPLQQQQGE